jgi:hypothetical protein
MRLLFASLGLVVGLIAAPALADDASPPPQAGDSVYRALQQVELTPDQVQHYIDSMRDMQAIMGNMPPDAAEPDAATMAKLGEVARKYGFMDFDDYNTVAGNISLALDGVDPDTKAYVGAAKLIEKSIAEAKVDKQMSAADRQAALADLQLQLKTVPQIKYQGNIDLVLKNYDKLTAQ